MPEYLHLGYDITDGLDGNEIRHPMSEDRGHIVVWGPEPERARLRNKLIAQVEEKGCYDLIEIDLAQVSLRTFQEEVRERNDEPTRAFVVVTNIPDDDEARQHVLYLFRTARSRGQVVYAEYDGEPSSARQAAVSASTLVLLGPNASNAAHKIVGLAASLSSPTDEYVASESSYFKPVPAVLT